MLKGVVSIYYTIKCSVQLSRKLNAVEFVVLCVWSCCWERGEKKEERRLGAEGKKTKTGDITFQLPFMYGIECTHNL
jgi:hypothetical protein